MLAIGIWGAGHGDPAAASGASAAAPTAAAAGFVMFAVIDPLAHDGKEKYRNQDG